MYSSVDFSVFIMLYNHYAPCFQNTSITPKRGLIPISSQFQLSPLPVPWQPLTHFLWICQFWKFHDSGLLQYVTFCVWLLALNRIKTQPLAACIPISTAQGFQFLWIVFQWSRLLLLWNWNRRDVPGSAVNTSLWLVSTWQDNEPNVRGRRHLHPM